MILTYTVVVDPDLQIRIGGGGQCQPIFFSVSSKIKGGPSPGSICHFTVDCFCLHKQHIESATKLPSSNDPSDYLEGCFFLTLPNLPSSYNQIRQLNSVMNISMELNRSPKNTLALKLG